MSNFNPNDPVNRVTDNQYTVSSAKGTFAPTRTYNESNIDLFSQNMFYDFPLNVDNTTPQYNGNLSEIMWRIADKPQQDYTYKYDELNRLKEAKYSDIMAINGAIPSFASDNKYGEKVTYDLRGNITSIIRRGMTQPCLDPNGFVCGEFGIIDNLGFNYSQTDRPNRLVGVTDGANLNEGFKFKGNGTSDYEYDPNGNLLVDKNKGIKYIEYNYMNLPVRIYFEGTGNYIDFVYDATGFKYKKEVVKSWSPVTEERIHYCQGLEYVSYNLDKIYQPEGYLKIEPDNGVGVYNYVLKDHLGNVRVTFSDANNDGVVGYADVKQVNNYYPFGMNMKGAWNGQKGQNRMQFNDQEFVGNFNNFDLDLYDYTYRYYDATIGRFLAVDALADYYPHYAPYQFAGNEVPNAIDLDGLEPFRGVWDNFLGNVLQWDSGLELTITPQNSGPQISPASSIVPTTPWWDDLAWYLTDGINRDISKKLKPLARTLVFLDGAANGIQNGLTLGFPGVLKDASKQPFSEDYASGQGGGAIFSMFLPIGEGAALNTGGGAIIISANGSVAAAYRIQSPIFNLLNPTIVKAVPNPNGAKGKQDHQDKVQELEQKAKNEAQPGEKVIQEKKIQGHPSNRRPDVQIVDKKGKTRKIFEAERRPKSKRNKKREAEYNRLGVDHETHGLD